MDKISEETAQATFGFPDEGFGEVGEDGKMRHIEIYKDTYGEIMAVLEVDEEDGGYFVRYASPDL